MPTVVHVASGDLYAGAEVQLYQLVKQLHSIGAQRVAVILLNPGILERRLRSLGVDVYVFDESRLGSMRIFLGVLQRLWKLRPEVVHTHRRKENVIGGVAARLAGVTAVVQTVHGLGEEGPKAPGFAKRAYNLADRITTRLIATRVVAVSPELACRLVFLPKWKVEVIENGIDVEEYVADNLLQGPLPGAGECTKIALVGRLVPVKRVDIFLRVARHLVDEFPDRFCFYVFGDGPQAEELKALRRDLGLDCCVHFMGFQERLGSFLAKMDFLLITSDHEGLPMTLLEAMAMNVGIVAHAVGGISQVLGHGRFGKLVKHQDVLEYAAGIRDSVQNVKSTEERTRQARERVGQMYTAAACAARHMDLYQSLCKR